MTSKQSNLWLVASALLATAAFCGAESPRAVPTFHCISLYWNVEGGTAENTCQVRYRPKGSEGWRAALPLWYDGRGPETFGRLYSSNRDRYAPNKMFSVLSHSHQYRGSVVNLRPATEYEIELSVDDGKQRQVVTTKTWSEKFPIGKTIILTEQSAETCVIKDSGSARGYVLYTHGADADTATVDVGGKRDYCIEVRASYVVIRDLTLKNAGIHGIRIFPGCHDVVIEQCDISGWGRRDEREDQPWGRDMDAAVFARERDEFNPTICRIIIQRCKIHNPRYDTNSWSEYRKRLDPDRKDRRWHPLGPQAVTFYDTLGNHVIRYNEVWSDPNHYYNDIIGGGHNFSALGSPNRDSDIYGNRLQNCWDDAIESEGANCNVRIWGNYISHSMVAIAGAATHIGPLYIWRNVTAVSQRAPDTHGGGPFLKAGIGSGFGGGRTYVFHNTLLQPSAVDLAGESGWQGYAIGLSEWGGALIDHVSRNNIWHVFSDRGYSIRQRSSRSRDNDYDYDFYSGRIVPAEGQEMHGIEGRPVYKSRGARGQYYLSPTSPGFDAGLRIANFNDGFVGDGPDMGAFEAGAPPLEFGVTAYLGEAGAYPEKDSE
jgi:hypothetical protein